MVEESKYLGIFINKYSDYNQQMNDKYTCVERSLYSLNNFGIKYPGINPETKAFIYKTYCLPKATYGLGVMEMTKTTINSLNTRQNTLIRYMLGLPSHIHISNIARSLGILNWENLYLVQKCIMIKLLHRNDSTKKLLINCLNEQNDEKCMINEDIKKISDLLNVNKHEVIYYPDKMKKLIEEKYLKETNVQEVEKITNILHDYTFKNKKKLIEMVKLTNKIINAKKIIISYVYMCVLFIFMYSYEQLILR